MSSLLIVGAGAFATEVDELARLCGYNDVAFLDDNPSAARCTPVIGKLEDIKALRGQFDSVAIAFGNNQLRMKYYEIAEKNGYNLPTLVHPTAYVSPDAIIASSSKTKILYI